MYSKLRNCKENKVLVAIYSNERECESFSVGYVRELTEEKVIILNVGIHGEYDGYTAMYLDDILRLEVNSKYLCKISILQNFDEEKVLKPSITDEFFHSLIKEAVNENLIIAISYGSNDEEIRGYATKKSDKIFITQINEYGEADGETVINIKVVNKVVIDDVECRDIERLYKYNTKV